MAFAWVNVQPIVEAFDGKEEYYGNWIKGIVVDKKGKPKKLLKAKAKMLKMVVEDMLGKDPL